MSDGARITRLRLTASRDEDVARGAILVGDALAIATLPQARSARHYVVRRLDIGGFSRDAAPQTVALQIERSVARLTAHAVRADDAAAAAAPIVWFDDEASAIVALAERVVAGPPPVEWFWRRIAGGAIRQPSRDAVLLACLAAAAATSGGSRAVAHIVERVERARPGAILGALDSTAAAAFILRVFETRAPAATPAAPDAAAAIRRLPPVWRALVETWLPRWDGDARAVLLLSLALVAAGAVPPTAARLLARAQAIVVATLAPVPLARPGDPSAASDTVRVPDILPALQSAAPEPAPLAAATEPPPLPAVATALVPPPGDPRAASLARSTDLPASRSVPAPATSPAPAASTAVATPPPPPPSLIPDGTTTVGGLFFLLRPLVALDLAGWLDRHTWAADSAFAARLLAELARDHGADDDDPLRLALAVPAAADPALDRPLVRRAWERAMARWLAAAELTLDGVVPRPAHVACTPTHIDVCFPLQDASIAVRLAGLDLDPGWVPWLGRVIRFHYLEEPPWQL